MKELFNYENEMTVLGCMIQSSNARNYIILTVNQDYFYREEHKFIYNAILDISKTVLDIDILMIHEKLPKIPMSYLTRFIDNVPALSNYKYYTENLIKYYVFRKYKQAAQTILEIVETENNIEGLSNQSESLILNAGLINEVETVKTMAEICQQSADRMEKIFNGYEGIKTYYKSLDKIIGWFEEGQLIVIGARPAMGKTLFLGNLALNMVKKDKKVAIFELEMTARELNDRFIAAESGVNHWLITKEPKLMNHKQGVDAQEALEKIKTYNLFIDDSSNSKVGKIINKIKMMKRRKNIDIVFIDHLTLIQPDINTKNRNYDVGQITKGLKTAAKELKIPIVLISQLNRNSESRASNKPGLSDLRESGEIEQDIDTAMFLYREEYYKEDTEKKNILEISIQKNRNGECGHCELLFYPQISKIIDIPQHNNF